MTRPSEPRGNAGFALVIVLWTLVLLALITGQLTAGGRVELRIAGNLAANAAAEAAADGAIYRAIFGLIDPARERAWLLDGSSRRVAVGDCAAVVRLDDEAARINPNLAAPELVEALLQVTGSDADKARQLARAIAEWVGAPGAARTADAMTAEYKAAGLDYRPPGEPVESVDELQRVLGMSAGVFAAMRPYLSPFGAAEPELAHADPVVAAAVAAVTPPDRAPRPGGTLTARLGAAVECAGNARARRTAIVRIDPQTHDYRILAWPEDD